MRRLVPYARRSTHWQRGHFGDAICEVALQTRWQTKIIINVPRTDGEALNAPSAWNG